MFYTANCKPGYFWRLVGVGVGVRVGIRFGVRVVFFWLVVGLELSLGFVKSVAYDNLTLINK